MIKVVAVRPQPKRISTVFPIVRVTAVATQPKYLSGLIRPARAIGVSLPGPRGGPGQQGDPGPKGDPGPPGPPSIIVSDTPPSNPSVGTLWLDTS